MRTPRWTSALVLALILSPAPAAAVCGNSVVEPPEQCDEGAANGTPASDCTTACEEVIPPVRVPGGGSKSTDCHVETVFDLAPPRVDQRGLPTRRQLCVDGDPTCDRDPAPGACSFAFWVCVAGADTAHRLRRGRRHRARGAAAERARRRRGGRGPCRAARQARRLRADGTGRGLQRPHADRRPGAKDAARAAARDERRRQGRQRHVASPLRSGVVSG